MNNLINNIKDSVKKIFPKGSPLWLVYRYTRKLLTFYKHQGAIGISQHTINHNIVLHKYKAIYFPIPKVACSSLKMLSADLLDMKVVGSDLKEDIHHQDFPCVKKYKIYKQYKHYFKFCFVRNPWDRLVSCYMNKICHVEDINRETAARFIEFGDNSKIFRIGMSFEEFINAVCDIPDERADAHIISQHTYITDDAGNLLVDFIGKLENIESDFSYVCDKIDIKGIELPHLMTSKHKKYQKYFNEETKEMVRKRYQRDIDMFDYEF